MAGSKVSGEASRCKHKGDYTALLAAHYQLNRPWIG